MNSKYMGHLEKEKYPLDLPSGRLQEKNKLELPTKGKSQSPITNHQSLITNHQRHLELAENLSPPPKKMFFFLIFFFE